MVGEVGEALPALVVDDQAAEAREPLEEPPHCRVLEGDLEVPYEPRDEHELQGAVAELAVRDAHPAAVRVANQRWSMGT